MQILHISSEKTWRGGEQQIAYLLEESSKLGVNNHVLCRNQSAFENYCDQHNIEHFNTEFSGFGLFKSARLLKKIAPNYDVIHAHTAKAHLLCFYALLLGMKAKVVVARRVDFTPSQSWLTRMRYEHKSIQKIICVSEAIKNIMQAYLKKNATRCTTIYSGIDLSKFKNQSSFDVKKHYGIAPDKILIGNTSALADHKDYFTFLDTARIILEQNQRIYFLIFGEGPLEREIKTYAQDLGIEKNILFTGFVDNIPEILPQIDVFLITSKTEGLGTSILDAFACKVPVVATEAGGIPELVEHGKTGLSASVGDSRSLAEHVFKILNDSDLKASLIENAYTKLQLFSKENTAKKTVEIYREITS